MLNLNVKDMKNFRDTLALWHIADFKKADADISKNKFVKNCLGTIANDEELLARIDNGTFNGTMTREELLAEIESQKALVKNERERVASLKDEFDKDTQKGLAIIPESLVNALISAAADMFSADKEQIVIDELVDWFKSNGAKNVVADDVTRYARCAYAGIRVSGAKGKCLNQCHNTTEKSLKMKNIFLGAICDEPTMKAILPVHKWENIIEKKTKKSAN